jgi:ketosteroid isomerase-like protein
MSDLDLARAGLYAWTRGDFEALENLLAPDATWRAVEPGEWDCESREEVLRTLRDRYEQGFTMGPFELVEGVPGKVILVSHPAKVGGPEWPEEKAMVVTFRDGRVVAMQDCSTLADARRALRPGVQDFVGPMGSLECERSRNAAGSAR